MFLQVPENWFLGINYSVNGVNRFELDEIVIIQRSDGRKTFASICSIDNANNEYECKVTDFLPFYFILEETRALFTISILIAGATGF
jgi:hypothetical protein